MSKQMILREVKGLNEKAGGGRWQFWHGRWYSERSIASHLHSDQWIKLNVTPLEGATLYHCSLSVNAWLHSWSRFKIGRLTAQSSRFHSSVDFRLKQEVGHDFTSVSNFYYREHFIGQTQWVQHESSNDFVILMKNKQCFSPKTEFSHLSVLLLSP